jgi:transcriptional/translational regulatory protein YebC/TACO1
MLILVALLLVIILVVNDNKARRIEKMKRRLKKSNASYETQE